MKKSISILLLILSLAPSFTQGQTLQDDFNRAASADLAGSLKWNRLLNLNDTSATFQINADSSISPKNQLGPVNRGGVYWDTLLGGPFQVGMVLRQKNGSDGVPSFHLYVMNDSDWFASEGYALRFQANPGQDRIDLQRFIGNGTDTPTVVLLSTLNREFFDGDTLFLKVYPDGRKTGVYYSVTGERDSITVVDTASVSASWIPWVEGRVFSTPLKLDNFMLGPIGFPITATAGAGGTITPSGVVLVDPGDSAAFSIAPNAGYFIADVRVDTGSVGPVTNYTFTAVNESHSIEAFFDTLSYTIAAAASAGGSITPSGTVDVNYGGGQSFTAAPNTGYHVDSVVVDGVNLGALTNYDFTNVTANHTITAYFSINVYTITATASAGGSISPSGAVSVNHGGSQSFAVAPDTGYHLDSVVVDGTNQGAVTNHDFTNVTANHVIAAYFTINSYTITATASAGGSITPSGAVSVNHGGGRSFAVAPNTGYHVDSVVVDGANQGAVTNYDFTNVTEAHTIAAYFTINTYTITATASSGGSIVPFGALPVAHGDSVAFAVTPNTGSHIDSVVVDGVSQGALTQYTFTAVSANHTIAAYFSINTYTITAAASAGGSITPSGGVIVSYGANRAFAIAPNTGYHTDSVVADGVNLGALTNYNFTNVTANHTIAAYFSPDVFTITATAAAGGTITPSGSVNVTYGNGQSFSIAPDTGYHIDSVVADGVNLGALTSHDFTNVTANHVIAAYFTINSYTITASASAGGSITPSGSVSVVHGGGQSFTVAPNTGYHIDSVVADGVNLGVLTSHDFTNVTEAHTIAAYFSIDVLTIAASASAGGSISPSGAVGVNYGDDRSFTITPNTGWHLDSVVVDGTNQGAVANYDFTNVTAGHAISAYFTINSYTITASASAGGGITPSGGVSVGHGGGQSFAITPSAGYHVDSVVVDGANQGAVTNYDFANVTAPHTIAAYFSIDTFSISALPGPNGSIAPPGVTSVAFGDSVAYTITPATGYFIADVWIDSVSIGAASSYTFTGVSADHTIAAAFSITPYTIVASASAGGTISPPGAVGVNYGADQSFTVAPNAGFHIDSVVVDGVGQGAVTGYDFTNVTTNHSIAAYFSVDVFTITATASSGGTITPSGAVGVNYGANRSFAAAPNTGYHVDSLVVDGINVGPAAAYDFNNVTSNHAIAAYFSIDVFTVTAGAGANGSISPAGATQVAFGGTVGYTIAPDAGYYIVSVHVDTVSVGAVSSYTFTNVTSNHTITASFALLSFSVSTTASAGGSVSPAGSTVVNYGDSLMVTMTPAAGHHLDSVVVDGLNLGAAVTYTFLNVTAGHALAAYFSPDVYTITASATAGGTIAPAGSVPVSYGAGQSFAITPAAGHLVDSVVVDGVNQGAVTTYDFTNVTAGHTIQAYFSIMTFQVTAVAGANGTVSPAGVSTLSYGDSLTIVITPDTGYHVDSVLVDGVDVGVPAAYTFLNVAANHTIQAYFSLTAFTITASSSSGGAVTPSGVVGVSFGANRSFTMTPNTGYHVDSVLVDGVNAGALAAYTFTNVTANHAIAAYFSINHYTITASAGSGGAISPSGSLDLTHGSSQTYTITPSTGYMILDVLVDGVSVGQPASYSFTNVSAGHTIQALFALRTFTITATAGPNGAVTPAGASTVNYGDSLTYAVTPNPGFYIQGVVVDGVPVGVITAYTFTNVNADHTIAAAFTSNATPTSFALVSPADNAAFPPLALTALKFTWRRSFDANPGDILNYVLTLTGPGVNFSSFNLTDTTVTLDLRGLAITNFVPYRWTVRVTDGTVTVASPDTFTIRFDPTTAVGDGREALPEEYALGQNYPNPFNPSTSIPFDLPERSEVTLRMYNILGVEVMDIVTGESMAAGSYVREADFSRMPSGAYFCRFIAKGESGVTFEKMMRLVLVR